jgi:hypothetical protein
LVSFEDYCVVLAGHDTHAFEAEFKYEDVLHLHLLEVLLYTFDSSLQIQLNPYAACASVGQAAQLLFSR